MRSQRAVLALRYTPVSVAGGVRKAVGGFLRYVQYRDQHNEPEPSRAVDAYVRYVAYRDRTSPAGRVFGREGGRTDADRRRLVEYVARSIRDLEPKWVMRRDGTREDRQRAVYTLVLSPEDWRGLDLRRIARAAMRELESSAGPGGIGPWFGAEHRNTAHHHVHIVLAARREVAAGRFSTLLITRTRLQRMKDAIAHEVARQRGGEHQPSDEATPRTGSALRTRAVPHHPFRARLKWLPPSATNARVKRWSPERSRRLRPIAASVLRLRAAARQYQSRMERELEDELAHQELEAWSL